MHRQAETAAALRVVADVEHGATGRGIGAMQPVDTGAKRQYVIEQAEIGEHRQAGRLQDQPGADRLRLLEALEDGDPVPGTLEIERHGQPRRTGACNCDIVGNADAPKPNWPGQSFSRLMKSSRGA